MEIELTRTRVPGLRVYDRKKKTAAPNAIVAAPQSSSSKVKKPIDAPPQPLSIFRKKLSLNLPSKESVSIPPKDKEKSFCFICASPFPVGNKGHRLTSLIGNTKIRNHASSSWSEFGITFWEALDVVFEVTRKAEELDIFVDMQRESVCSTCICHFAQLYAKFVEFVEIAEVGALFKRLLERNEALKKHHSSRIPNTVVEQTDGPKISRHRECSPPLNYKSPPNEDFEAHLVENVLETGVDDDWAETEIVSHVIEMPELGLGNTEETSETLASASQIDSGNSNVVSRMPVPTFSEVKKKPIEGVLAFRSRANVDPSLMKFTIANKQRLRCTGCEYYFNNFEQLLGHFLKCHPGEHKDIDDIKAQVLRDLQNPPKHRLYIPKPKSKLRKPEPVSWECTICPKIFPNKRSYKRHMRRRRHAPDRFKCTECDSGFRSGKELRSHIKTLHPGVRILKKKKNNGNTMQVAPPTAICPVCSKDLVFNSRLEKHLAANHRPRIRIRREKTCTDCNKLFQTYGGYFYHKRAHHRTKPERVQCTVCGFSTANANRLEEHMQNRHNDDMSIKTLLCLHPNCGKAFRTKAQFRRHSVRHDPYKRAVIAERNRSTTTVRNFETCPHPGCNKVYDSRYRTVHAVCHITTRDFICDQCGKAFKTSGALQIHISGVHLRLINRNRKRRNEGNMGVEGVRPFVCPAEGCGKAYRLLGTFNRHKYRHESLLQFPCSHCPNAYFTNLRGLKTHMGSRHSLKWRNGRWE